MWLPDQLLPIDLLFGAFLVYVSIFIKIVFVFWLQLTVTKLLTIRFKLETINEIINFVLCLG